MTRQTLHDELLKRLKEKRRFLQVLAGPRQVGKTTLVRQVMQATKLTAHYASADEPTLRDRTWIEQQWDAARPKARENKSGGPPGITSPNGPLFYVHLAHDRASAISDDVMEGA